MKTALAVLAVLLSTASADRCPWNKTADICPDAGQACNNEILCSKGLFCRIRSQGSGSYSGICDVAPDISSVYGKACNLGNDIPECVFNDPLRLSPKDKPSALQCVRAYQTDSAGTCRVGPNKHGDACKQDGECASGNCESQIGLCKGIDEGELCTPGYPDPCGSNHYCAPTMGSGKAVCQKSVSAGRSCKYSAACERGFYCAGSTWDERKCTKPFSIASGLNTTIGPYMCESANAIIVTQMANPADSIYTCVDANSTLIGTPCDSTKRAPLGYDCKCSSDGESRLVTKGLLGLGSRAQVWKDLFTCLNTATGIMGDLCEFDSLDMERVRYGSCGYYSCYPYYLKLVNNTGGRVFTPEFSRFVPYADCEVEAAKTYYDKVMNTECLSLPGLDNWKCAKLIGPESLSVASTNAILFFVLTGVMAGYVYHSILYPAPEGTPSLIADLLFFRKKVQAARDARRQ